MQLANSINKIADGSPIATKRGSDGGIDEIYPVIVCYDRSVAITLIRDYLDEQLRGSLSETARRKLKVARLAVLSPEDIELLQAVCRSYSLLSVLNAYKREAALLMTFHNFLTTRYAQLLRHPDPTTMDRCVSLMQEASRRVFGAELNAPPGYP